VTIQTIIKNTIKRLREQNEMMTPRNYERAFCFEAKKHGVVIEDCSRVDKFIQKLAPKYQKELYRRNIKTLDELFTFLTTVLNRLDKEESAAVIKSFALLLRRVVQAATLHKDNALQDLAKESLEKIDTHMSFKELESLRGKWNAFVMSYDDSYMQKLQKYLPVDSLQHRDFVAKVQQLFIDQPDAQASFEKLAEVFVAAMVPSIASQGNDEIAKVSGALMKNPQALETNAMLEDIKSAVKVRIAADKAQIGSQVQKLNEIIETLSSKLVDLRQSSHENSHTLKGIKGQLQDVEFDPKNFENLQEKLLFIVNSLESETNSFHHDIKSKEEEVHNLKNRVHLLEKALRLEKQRSNTDQLTKLPNRRGIDSRLEDLDAEFKRYNKNFTVVLFDIDKFKSINDNYGHDAGDVILSNLGKILQKHKRQTDLVGRMGGEEFIALLPFTDTKEALNFAQKIRQSVQEAKFMYKGTRMAVTISGGVAQRKDFDDVASMIKHSDRLLYKAKDNGRNNIQS